MFYQKNPETMKHYILERIAGMSTIYSVFAIIFPSRTGCLIKKKYSYSKKYAINCLIFDGTLIKKHQNPLYHEIIKP